MGIYVFARFFNCIFIFILPFRVPLRYARARAENLRGRLDYDLLFFP